MFKGKLTGFHGDVNHIGHGVPLLQSCTASGFSNPLWTQYCSLTTVVTPLEISRAHCTSRVWTPLSPQASEHRLQAPGIHWGSHGPSPHNCREGGSFDGSQSDLSTTPRLRRPAQDTLRVW